MLASVGAVKSVRILTAETDALRLDQRWPPAYPGVSGATRCTVFGYPTARPWIAP